MNKRCETTSNGTKKDTTSVREIVMLSDPVAKNNMFSWFEMNYKILLLP